MTGPLLVDTGPLVAYLDQRDRFHEWAIARIHEAEPPMLTCEAVLSEATHLLRHVTGGRYPVAEMLRRGSVRIAFSLQEEADAVAALLRKYGDVPMSLADACLVRMTELTTQPTVLTIDHDFTIYRRHGRQPIPVVRPDPAG